MASRDLSKTFTFAGGSVQLHKGIRILKEMAFSGYPA
jgi:hypothetical protein